ncbi:diadenylate cyclase, partial [Methanosalsum natronophilum]
DVSIDKGLGGRHVSAATITRDTVALAVTISESGGVVRVYMDGIMKFSIETSERVIKLN